MNKKLREIIEKSSKAVFFGGAGVSTESGIPDFRGVDGLYAQKFKYPPEQILSHTFFMSNPTEFFHFYREKMIFPDVKPNDAHIALAELEQRGILKAVITQNIDGLHSAAGSKKVLELHGSIHRNYCVACKKAYTLDFIRENVPLPLCSCGAVVKPDVVLYEEQLDDNVVREAVRFVSQADTLIIGGTSLSVYPAASLIDYFRGENLVLINKTPTHADRYATLVIREPIGEAMRLDF